jgi:hypothetical protein
VESGESNEYKGRTGIFLLKRSDGNVQAYNGTVLLINETHIRLRLRDGKECDLLRADILKVEWTNGGRA